MSSVDKSSYRLSIVTVLLSSAVRPQFAMDVIQGGSRSFVTSEVM